MEAEIDEDKPMIVKNSIHARKTLQRRAKTNKFKRARSSSEYKDWLQFCFVVLLYKILAAFEFLFNLGSAILQVSLHLSKYNKSLLCATNVDMVPSNFRIL